MDMRDIFNKRLDLDCTDEINEDDCIKFAMPEDVEMIFGNPDDAMNEKYNDLSIPIEQFAIHGKDGIQVIFKKYPNVLFGSWFCVCDIKKETQLVSGLFQIDKLPRVYIICSHIHKCELGNPIRKEDGGLYCLKSLNKNCDRCPEFQEILGRTVPIAVILNFGFHMLYSTMKIFNSKPEKVKKILKDERDRVTEMMIQQKKIKRGHIILIDDDYVYKSFCNDDNNIFEYERNGEAKKFKDGLEEVRYETVESTEIFNFVIEKNSDFLKDIYTTRPSSEFKSLEIPFEALAIQFENDEKYAFLLKKEVFCKESCWISLHNKETQENVSGLFYLNKLPQIYIICDNVNTCKSANKFKLKTKDSTKVFCLKTLNKDCDKCDNTIMYEDKERQIALMVNIAFQIVFNTLRIFNSEPERVLRIKTEARERKEKVKQDGAKQKSGFIVFRKKTYHYEYEGDRPRYETDEEREKREVCRHYRKKHWRHYKSGKVIEIEKCIVNKDKEAKPYLI